MDQHASGAKTQEGKTPDPSALRYRDLLRVRRTEEAIGQLYALGHIPHPVALSIGREALFAGLTDGREPADAVFVGRRCHGLLLVLGLPVATLFDALAQDKAGLFGATQTDALQKFCARRAVHLIDGMPQHVLIEVQERLAVPGAGDGVPFTVIDCAQEPTQDIAQCFSRLAHTQHPLVILLDLAIPNPGAPLHAKPVWIDLCERAGFPIQTIEGFDRDLVARGLRAARQSSCQLNQPVVLAVSTEAFRGHAVSAFQEGGEHGVRRSGFDPVARVRARAITGSNRGGDVAAEIEAGVRAELAKATQAVREKEKDRSGRGD